MRPLTTKTYDRRASGDCGTSGSLTVAVVIRLKEKSQHPILSIYIYLAIILLHALYFRHAMCTTVALMSGTVAQINTTNFTRYHYTATSRRIKYLKVSANRSAKKINYYFYDCKLSFICSILVSWFLYQVLTCWVFYLGVTSFWTLFYVFLKIHAIVVFPALYIHKAIFLANIAKIKCSQIKLKKMKTVYSNYDNKYFRPRYIVFRSSICLCVLSPIFPAYIQRAIFKVLMVIQSPNLDYKFT